MCQTLWESELELSSPAQMCLVAGAYTRMCITLYILHFKLVFAHSPQLCVLHSYFVLLCADCCPDFTLLTFFYIYASIIFPIRGYKLYVDMD